MIRVHPYLWMMSSASYVMWKTGHSARGDLWLTHITHTAHGLDMGSKSNVLCVALWVAFTVVGVVVQNSCCRPPLTESERLNLLKRDAMMNGGAGPKGTSYSSTGTA